jgi:hypothetical protein
MSPGQDHQIVLSKDRIVAHKPLEEGRISQGPDSQTAFPEKLMVAHKSRVAERACIPMARKHLLASTFDSCARVLGSEPYLVAHFHE